MSTPVAISTGSRHEDPIVITLRAVTARPLDVPLARVRHRLTRLVRGPHYALKRPLDVVVSTLGLVVVFPLMPLIALAIRADSPGHALFSQTRVGRGGRLFEMWKFRSMTSDAETRRARCTELNDSPDGVIFKATDDPRVTRLGRILRKTSIDELPQLVNVLVGDMSLVGPRPPIPSEVDEYARHDLHRLNVVPGMTCLWQVSGRSELGFARQVQLDAQYVRSQSLLRDLWILLRTIPAVIVGRGAK